MIEILKDKLKRFGVSSQDLDEIEESLQIKKLAMVSHLQRAIMDC